MADLVVKSDLTDLAQELTWLVSEFKGALDLENDTARHWGQHHANLTMGDFADNWTAHRDEMVVDMEKLCDAVHKVADGWRENETGLYHSLPERPESGA